MNKVKRDLHRRLNFGTEGNWVKGARSKASLFCRRRTWQKWHGPGELSSLDMAPISAFFLTCGGHTALEMAAEAEIGMLIGLVHFWFSRNGYGRGSSFLDHLLLQCVLYVHLKQFSLKSLSLAIPVILYPFNKSLSAHIR